MDKTPWLLWRWFDRSWKCPLDPTAHHHSSSWQRNAQNSGNIMEWYLCHWKPPALDWQLTGNSSEYLRVAKHLDIVSFNCFVSLETHTPRAVMGRKRCSFLAESCVLNSRCKICSHEEAQKIKIYGGFCNSGSVIWQGQRDTQVGGNSTSAKPLEGKSLQFTPHLWSPQVQGFENMCLRRY